MSYLRSFFIATLLCGAALHADEKAEAAKCSVYFSPEDHLDNRLISLIDAESKSIRIAIYCLTHHKIGKALIEAKKRGVDVAVIVDPFSVKARSPIAKLDKEGVSVFVWNPTVELTKAGRRPLMHDKFCVFGSRAVWTGSFNFTYEATANHQENAVLLENSEIAKRYEKQFERVKERGCVPYKTFVEEKKKPDVEKK